MSKKVVAAKKSVKSKFNLSRVDTANKSEPVKRAILIHNQTVSSISNFHSLYVQSHDIDPASPGYADQDLLRAMLLFSCSGLDAVVKQLVQDTLESVLKYDEGAQREFRKYVERRLKKAGNSDDRDRLVAPSFTDTALLAELLVSFDPRSTLISNLTRSLLSDSLQSRDQLLKVASHFAVTKDEIMLDERVTQNAFVARNQMTHEMDIDLEGGRLRRERQYEDITKWCLNIIEISNRFIESINSKITQKTI